MKEFATSNLEIFTPEMMKMADNMAISSGIPSIELMEKAGKAVFYEVVKFLKKQAPSKRKITILCGPGNNGGDGFVIARLLIQKKYKPTLFLLGDIEKLKGDGALAANKYIKAKGKISQISHEKIANSDVVIDAIFGTGLSKAIGGEIEKIIETVNKSGAKIFAVDIASGIDGNSGKALRAAITAHVTITFQKKKLGHVLYPGKIYSGRVIVKDIGIKNEHMKKIKKDFFENSPEIWLKEFPFFGEDSHKYKRGHTTVLAGEKEGAAILAASAALRTGSGLVTILYKNLSGVYKISPSVMAQKISDERAFINFIKDERINSLVIGPGSGVNDFTRFAVLEALAQNKNIVLDADAITAFAENNLRNTLFDLIKNSKGKFVFTPHEGEFKKLFPEIKNESKVERAQKAAKESGAVILLKGPDTVIAEPNGKVIINNNSSKYLATAGSGDVLSGIIAGLIAQGMEIFLAASAASWLHGEAAKNLGIGMMSEDLIAEIPNVLKKLENKK